MKNQIDESTDIGDEQGAQCVQPIKRRVKKQLKQHKDDTKDESVAGCSSSDDVVEGETFDLEHKPKAIRIPAIRSNETRSSRERDSVTEPFAEEDVNVIFQGPTRMEDSSVAVLFVGSKSNMDKK